MLVHQRVPQSIPIHVPSVPVASRRPAFSASVCKHSDSQAWSVPICRLRLWKLRSLRRFLWNSPNKIHAIPVLVKHMITHDAQETMVENHILSNLSGMPFNHWIYWPQETEQIKSHFIIFYLTLIKHASNHISRLSM